MAVTIKRRLVPVGGPVVNRAADFPLPWGVFPPVTWDCFKPGTLVKLVPPWSNCPAYQSGDQGEVVAYCPASPPYAAPAYDLYGVRLTQPRLVGHEVVWLNYKDLRPVQ